jgi:hypothetical protein
MQVNPYKGPDLVGEERDVELKFCLVPAGKRMVSWTAFDYQVRYGETSKPFFWGLATYELDRPVRRIRTTDPQKLEEYVRRRELYIVSSNWINQFPPHETRGRTSLSQWENTFRYPKFNLLPLVKRTHTVRGGLVHLTEGVPEGLFNLN